ncbi:MAG: sulfatase [Planctomycetales bacterium]
MSDRHASWSRSILAPASIACRRSGIRLVRCALAFLLCVVSARGDLDAAPPSVRPNILWICADDLAAYACGAYGGQRARTPSIDRLAARGMRFDRAFCNSPVCTASRQSFLTGRYPRTIGVTQLSTPLPDSEQTLAELLGDAGYQTAAIGKMHFNSDLRHGFELRLDLPDFQRLLKDRGARPVPAGIAVQPLWKPFRDPARIWLNSACLPSGAFDADMPGTWLAQQAAEYLTSRRDNAAASAPFLLMVSFYEPHSPFHFPIEYRDRMRPADFAVPSVGPDDDSQIPAIFRDLTPLEKQGIAAAYHTSVEFLDRNVGLVLEGLERSGVADNTLVVFTGDHGYLLGHHGCFEKHCSFDEAIRAPLLVSLPGRIASKGKSSALVEFIDLAPTLLEYCGLQSPAKMQGKSLVPLLSGQTARHRGAVFVEYSENEEAAIRTERWKFIYGTGQRERQDGYTTGRPLPGRTIRLYDLSVDPGELNNLADDPAHADQVVLFTRQLATHLRQTARQPELIPQTDDLETVLNYCLAPRDVSQDR